MIESKVWQEFYCNDCDGYIRLKLNVEICRPVRICCPNPSCARHKDGHPRVIQGGMIISDHGGGGKESEEIMPPLSAYSKESINAPKNIKHTRVGVKLDPNQLPQDQPTTPTEIVVAVKEPISEITKMPPRDPASDAIIRQSWFDRFGYYPARREE